MLRLPINACYACSTLNKSSISAVGRVRALHQKIPTLWKQRSFLYDECSRVAQWKRAGPITQRSVDRNHALLKEFFLWAASLPTVPLRHKNVSRDTNVPAHGFQYHICWIQSFLKLVLNLLEKESKNHWNSYFFPSKPPFYTSQLQLPTVPLRVICVWLLSLTPDYSQNRAFELARIRTWNLLIRSQTRYPLRHKPRWSTTFTWQNLKLLRTYIWHDQWCNMLRWR